MKLTTGIKIAIICLLVLASCGVNRDVFYKKNDTHLFGKFLQEVVNDTVFYDIPALNITNHGLYKVLDSVIHLAEECEYFDSRVPSLHAFLFSFERKDDGTLLYAINTNLSVEASLDILFRKALNPDLTIDKGVFYYKNYLFSVPMYSGQVMSEFDFFENAKFNHRIKATGLPNDLPLLNYVRFIQNESEFSIIDDKSCNPPALVAN